MMYCTDEKWVVRMLMNRSLTQAVPTHWNTSSVVWVSLHKQSINSVNLLGNRVHDGLTVRGTIVEENI